MPALAKARQGGDGEIVEHRLAGKHAGGAAVARQIGDAVPCGLGQAGDGDGRRSARGRSPSPAAARRRPHSSSRNASWPWPFEPGQPDDLAGPNREVDRRRCRGQADAEAGGARQLAQAWAACTCSRASGIISRSSRSLVTSAPLQRLDRAAAAQHGDPVRHAPHLVQAVRDEQHQAPVGDERRATRRTGHRGRRCRAPPSPRRGSRCADRAPGRGPGR